MKPSRKSQPFFRRHSLSLAALAVVLGLIGLYLKSDPATHVGSFFGNAIADWTGVFVTIVMTKFLYEKGSTESRQPKGKVPSPVLEALREHSLTIFLVITGIGWWLRFGPWIREASGGKLSVTSFRNGRRFWGWCF